MQPVSFAYQMEEYLGMAFHSHPYYEIYYFHSGRCNYVIGSQVYSLVPGDLILMHGLTLHTPNPDMETPYIRSIFHLHPQLLYRFFHPSFLDPLLRPFEEQQNIRIQTGARKAEVELALARLASLYHVSVPSDQGRFLLHFADFLYLIHELCHTHGSDPILNYSGKERYVQQVIQYIETHYSRDITMEHIEKELHVSRHYVSRIFKEWTGWTVFQYLYRRRVNQAKIMLLLDNNLSVSHVSEYVGFKHHSHFSRIFKQLEGCTPESYRRNQAAHGRLFDF